MKKIAWLMPSFGKGSGGIRTILQNAKYLEENNYICDLYVEGNESPETVKKRISDDYSVELKGEIYSGFDIRAQYDVIIATYYATAKIALSSSAKKKMYFMQDYEPWFFPMSQNYLDAVDSYRTELDGITIGRWLAKKIHNGFGMKTRFFNFCADLDIYKPVKDVKKEKAICFIFQPDKPRRMVDLGLKALQIVQKEIPDIKIYLYGSQIIVPHNLNATHLGLITPADCAKLYNKCLAGLCLSATNPSRIPFEMMACGLPVVEAYLDNTIYDLPDDGCLLAERNPESIAYALIKIIKNKKIREKLSIGGAEYMKEFPLERGFGEFEEIIDDYMCCKDKSETIKKRYYNTAVVAPGSLKTVDEDVYFTPPSKGKRVLNKISGLKKKFVL